MSEQPFPIRWSECAREGLRRAGTPFGLEPSPFTADMLRVRGLRAKQLREKHDHELWLAQVRERLTYAIVAAQAGETAAFVWPSTEEVLRRTLDAAAAEIGTYHYDYA